MSALPPARRLSLKRAALWGLGVGTFANLLSDYTSDHSQTMAILKAFPYPDFWVAGLGYFGAGPLIFVSVAVILNGFAKKQKRAGADDAV